MQALDETKYNEGLLTLRSALRTLCPQVCLFLCDLATICLSRTQQAQQPYTISQASIYRSANPRESDSLKNMAETITSTVQIYGRSSWTAEALLTFAITQDHCLSFPTSLDQTMITATFLQTLTTIATTLRRYFMRTNQMSLLGITKVNRRYTLLQGGNGHLTQQSHMTGICLNYF